jgi:hypothetical protein
MIFCDFYGPAEIYQSERERLRQEVAAALRTSPDAVAVRRIVTEDERQEVELWVELSSEDQLYRQGQRLAERVSASVRERFEVQVWVMFRIVPLSHAFLDGQPRSRGIGTFE